MDTIGIILVCVGGLVVCLGCAYFVFVKMFMRNRKSIVRVVVPIKYLPPKKEVKLEKVIPFVRKLNKRDKRRIRIMVARKSFKAPSQNQEEEDEYYDEWDDEWQEEKDRPSTAASFMNFISSKFSRKTVNTESAVGDIEEGFDIDDEDEDADGIVGGRISEGGEKVGDEPVLSESKKSERFISQDRLDRAASRKKVIAALKPEIIVEEVPETVVEKDPIVAIIDLHDIKEDRVESLIDKRKRQRDELKKLKADGGEVDYVQLNSGPEKSLIPEGFKPSEVVPAISDKELVGKKCMFLLVKNGTEQRVGGWFPCRIAGPSKKEGCNYNIKFDRLETGTLFVDGIRNVELSLIGDNAYGRRWIVLVDAPVNGEKFVAVLKKKSRFN